MTARPTICLNMIVRNEAHIIEEVLGSVAPHIASWVIVDTGSDDGTQDVIRSHMAVLGIPGELHDRPWRDFGHNRSEALTLAKGHGDYIWVIDADDVVVGTPDFDGIHADVYNLRYGDGGMLYWRRQLFRDELHWRYVGVVHEYPDCDDPYVEERLEGDYYVNSRRLGARSQDPQKYARDRDLLLAEVERDPEDSRSAFYLAQSYYDLGDFANAHEWYARRLDMGGWDEEVYCAMFRAAESMSQLGLPWQEVQEAYLRAWEFRSIRAEPLHAIAYRYRNDQRYQLGHLFAERAAEIPLPADTLFVGADVYAWRITDEQAICASWIGRHEEAFRLCRRVLARADIPDDDRKRIAGNRDVSVPAVLETAVAYPDVLAQSRIPGPRDADIAVSLIAGPDRGATELTLNSFLNSCVDLPQACRVLVVNAGLSAEDRATLLERYRFLEFIPAGSGEGLGAQLAYIRSEIECRFWLHLGEGWQFFAPEPLISRLTAVLDAEPEVVQVGINVGDAVTLTGVSAAEDAVRRTVDGGRYVLTDVIARGPAMFDTGRVDRATADGLKAASLDEVLCIAAPTE
ncbi:MAG: glycosyl transferase, family 2 [Mycobacterium sp.]|nr:glycosyl transferase, family 2 [Mycobacterium sp.]